MSETTILLAYGLQLLRHGLRAVVEREPDFAVVGETGDGLAVVELVEQLSPGVLLVELALPGLNGLEITRQIMRRAPGTRVIGIAGQGAEARAAEVLGAGVRGYLLTAASGLDLVHAVREVIAGRRFLSPPLSGHVVESFLRKAHGTPPDVYETLTLRERVVLQLAAEGYTSKQIGAKLALDRRTVEDYRNNVRRKLSLRNQRELLLYALRRGLITLDD